MHCTLRSPGIVGSGELSRCRAMTLITAFEDRHRNHGSPPQRVFAPHPGSLHSNQGASQKHDFPQLLTRVLSVPTRCPIANEASPPRPLASLWKTAEARVRSSHHLECLTYRPSFRKSCCKNSCDGNRKRHKFGLGLLGLRSYMEPGRSGVPELC